MPGAFLVSATFPAVLWSSCKQRQKSMKEPPNYCSVLLKSRMNLSGEAFLRRARLCLCILRPTLLPSVSDPLRVVNPPADVKEGTGLSSQKLDLTSKMTYFGALEARASAYGQKASLPCKRSLKMSLSISVLTTNCLHIIIYRPSILGIHFMSIVDDI